MNKWRPSRHGHRLRLPHLAVSDVCEYEGCSARTTFGYVVDPDRIRMQEPLVIVTCNEHFWTWLTPGWTEDRRLPDPPTPLYHQELRRPGWSVWRRDLSTEEAVAAAGPLPCQQEGCAEQAIFLTWGVDRGVADKYYPRVCCPSHARDHARLNGTTLEHGGEYFSVNLTWTGTDWGRPLPWPLTEPAPQDLDH